MLIQDFVQLNAPDATVRERLRDPAARWLAAYADGESLFLRISALASELTIGKRVQVALGAAYAVATG